VSQSFDLRSKRILIVEDEWLIAMDIASAFMRAGASVTGPVSTIEEALSITQSGVPIDGAVLDLNLHGELAYPVADALSLRGIPILLATGYGENLLPETLRSFARFQKPFNPDDVVRAWALMGTDRQGPSSVALGRNGPLSWLSAAALDKLRPHMDMLELPRRTTLDAKFCYFLTSGVASCTLTNLSRKSVEVALIGPDGMTGPFLHGTHDSKQWAMVIDGIAARIDAESLAHFALQDRELAAMLQSASANLLVQVADNVMANASYTIEQRVARYLLLLSEKSRKSFLDITHDDIGWSLGVRRTSVTIAINHLANRGCVNHSRGEISVINRAELKSAAGGSYS